MRVEMNDRPHHHLVCTVCRSIFDVDQEELADDLGTMAAQPGKLPGGFLAERFAVDVIGRCVDCQATSAK